MFPFLEASSQNYVSLCHGYSLAILYLTSPSGGHFSVSKTTHRMWLRVLSTAFEEKLKVLDFVH